MSRPRSRVLTTALALPGLLALPPGLGCAPIDVDSKVTVHPRDAPVRQLGGPEQVDREHVVEFVQLGSRLLVSVRERPRCVTLSHVPVMRVEQIDRSNRNFVIWDFTLGVAFGGFSALAFARPQLFGDRLIDGQGRVVYDNTAGYTVGTVFAVLAVGLLTAGVVDAIRSRDETRYAEAYQLERGPETTCPGVAEAGTALVDRGLSLRIGELELDAVTDEQGRARFELPANVDVAGEPGTLAAVLVIAGPDDEAGASPGYLSLPLRVPFAGLVEAHTGLVDTGASEPPAAPIERRVIEGPARGPAPNPPEPEPEPEGALR